MTDGSLRGLVLRELGAVTVGLHEGVTTGFSKAQTAWGRLSEREYGWLLSMFARARLDNDNLDIHRLEAGANAYNKYGSGFVRYLTDDFDINGVKRENLDLGGEVYLTRNWGLSLYGNRDLQQDAWVIRDIGVVYRDDCTRIDFIYRKEDTILGRLGPSESFTIRLTLATLGEPLYGN